MKHLLLVLFLLVACDPTYLDNGRISRDGLELYSAPPLGVSASPEMRPFVLQAIDWWADQVGTEVFFSPTPTPDVNVTVGFVPAGDEFDIEEMTGENLGIAYLDYSRFDGLVTWCEIVISSDIAYHESTVLEVTKHELGHCLALDDDPRSLDLNSIMSSPLVWRGEVTPRDKAIVLADLEGM